MRTTVDIDRDVLMAIREIAAERRKTLGEVISDLARSALSASRGPSQKKNGVPLFPHREGVIVTMETVQTLQDDP